ncbi:MAG: VWA domain-containing protein [Planctomycetaceae bacterium]
MTWLHRFVRRIIPPARRAVRWTAAWPLITFLLIFGTAVIALVALNRVDFSYPWMFLLLLITPWMWWMQAAGHSGLTTSRGNMALMIRLLVTGLLVCVLAVPRSVKTSDIVSVVYDVDISDSVNDARESALSIVAETAAERPPKDEAGLVVFGRTPAVEYPPRESFPFEKYLNSQVAEDATNLQQSLSLSAAMLPEENMGRVVLISDGTETVGELKHAITELQARRISVDVLPIDVASITDEVYLERLDLPRFVRLGEPYEAAVVLSSLKDGSGTLVLLQNDEELTSIPVEFKAGKNRIAVPIKVDVPGYYEYEARIQVPSDKDYRSENNAVRNYLYLEGAGRILIVTDPGGNPKEWSYLQQALEAGEREVDVKSALSLPHDPVAMMQYDAIVFANVPADALIAPQIQAVHDAVRNLGIGFLMLGGPNSFGPGGYQNSPIEDCLPVSMEISKKKILPKGALVIILHTCEFPQGNAWAKRITKEAIRVLSAEDEVGAIGYGMNGDEWIFELTPASEYEKLVPKINGAQIGDMPEFTSTMEMGLKGLLKSDAASRHMIIISDGDPPLPPPKTLQAFKDAQASVSTVAIYPHDQRDALVLNAIASQTGGRFYFPSDPGELPSIFIKEAKTLRRSQIQKRTFQPMLLNDDPALRDITSMPPLHGYVLTSEKDDPRATVLLTAPPEEKDAVAEDSDVDPVLAVWRYGLGATAAYTSDLTDDWGKDWVKWDQFQQLVTQIMTRISRVRREQFLRVYTYVNGNEGVVVVEDFHPEEALLDMNVSVTSAEGFQYSGQVRQIAPRRYQATIPLQGKARYQVQISAEGTNRSEIAYGGFIVSYSPEYLRFQSNPIALRSIAEQTGGRELNPDLPRTELAQQIYGDRQPRRSTQPVFDWLLMTLACLIPLDVAVRRVQLDFRWLTSAFRRRKKESTATMGTLLEKAQSVRAGLAGKPQTPTTPPAAPIATKADFPRRPSTTRPDAAKPVPPATETQAAAKTDSPPSTPEDGSTTSRLLALKKKRDQEGK